VSKPRGERYSEEVINEAVALYESGEPVAEINRTFNLEKTTIYHFLKSRGIPARSKKNGKTDFVPYSQRVINSGYSGVVTVDKEGFVQDFQRKDTQTFEIVFSGSLEVEATSLEEAIANARKRVFVGRIHSIREK
jgi:hypothetical protein